VVGGRPRARRRAGRRDLTLGPDATLGTDRFGIRTSPFYLRYRAHKARLYVGTTASIPVLQQEIAYTAAYNGTGALHLGRIQIRGGPANPWNGAIDDVTVWGDALTDYEITQLS
jgi:hypothetical protein